MPSLAACPDRRIFLVSPLTIASWRRLDEEGPDALVRLPERSMISLIHYTKRGRGSLGLGDTRGCGLLEFP